jgi:hypothetical protein
MVDAESVISFVRTLDLWLVSTVYLQAVLHGIAFPKLSLTVNTWLLVTPVALNLIYALVISKIG